MAEVFSSSGEKTDNVVVPTPRLQGLFLPGIDNPSTIDGFGTVIPWGGGSTARRYADYGISIGRDTQLNDLASSFLPAAGVETTYNFEGLIGPQGPAGRDGIDGITQFIGAPNSNFLATLPYNLDSINGLGTAADKMLYTNTYITTVNFVWTNSPIASAVKSWNEADINDDASFLIIAGDVGVYVSTDDGDSWNTYDPNSEVSLQTQCADSGGKAVVLGETSRATGSIFVTENYGVAWTEKTVEV